MVSAITSIVGCIRNRASTRLATKTKPQQPSGCAAVTQQSLNKSVTQQKRKIRRVWDAEEIE